MKPCEYAMPFVVCPRANVSLALQAEEAWWIPLTGARSGMKRSPMTRISLEVMVGCGVAAFTASLSLLLLLLWGAYRATLEMSGDPLELRVLGLAFCATEFSSEAKRDKIIES